MKTIAIEPYKQDLEDRALDHDIDCMCADGSEEKFCTCEENYDGE